MPDVIKIFLYFIGLVMCGVSIGVLTITPPYAFLTIGTGLLVFPWVEKHM